LIAWWSCEAGIAEDVRKFATWPRAWTPASVRPEP